MFVSLYLSAVACVTATSLEEVNGVGGSAVMPSLAMSCLTSSYAACGSFGIFAPERPKNEPSAVPVYSG